MSPNTFDGIVIRSFISKLCLEQNRLLQNETGSWQMQREWQSRQIGR